MVFFLHHLTTLSSLKHFQENKIRKLPFILAGRRQRGYLPTIELSENAHFVLIRISDVLVRNRIHSNHGLRRNIFVIGKIERNFNKMHIWESSNCSILTKNNVSFTWKINFFTYSLLVHFVVVSVPNCFL